MNILVFGYGAVAQQRYVPNLREVISEAQPATEIRFTCVDKGKPGCLDAATWDREPGVRLEEFDRILVLSPPSAHYRNLSSIARRYSAEGCLPPDIYIEKPVYLQSEWHLWTTLLDKHPGLEERIRYVDHYRFKDALSWFLAHKSEIIEALGRIEELGFVSLEMQEFWDSVAFERGYFLEHACHLVGTLDRVFPGIRGREWIPQKTRDWRVWEQAGRPESCRRDSASLAFLTLSGERGPDVAEDVGLTVIVGKAMVDAKMLYLRGTQGFGQLWFNRGSFVLNLMGRKPAETHIPSGDAHRAVAKSIFARRTEPGLMLPLRQGMGEQELIIALHKRLPRRGATYQPGEVPEEITQVMRLMGL